MKIICIGHAAYDITLPVDAFPFENTKTRIGRKMECGGGPASNAAYLLGKWGADVSFLGIVGDDIGGHAIRKEFEKVGVSTSYLQISTEYPTPTGYIIVNQKTGTRTVLSYREPMQMKEVEVSFEPNFILMDGQEYQMSKKLLQEFPSAISVMDAGRVTEEIIELSSLCTYLICSKDFAEKITGLSFDFYKEETLQKIYQILEEKFHTIIVVTLEEKGCLYQENGKIQICSSISVNPIDSTGAGDIFHGAFVYALSKGYSFSKALYLSNVAGALSTEKMGSRHSIPSKTEMRKYIHGFE